MPKSPVTLVRNTHKQPRRVVATLSERVNIDAVLVLSPVVPVQEGE